MSGSERPPTCLVLMLKSPARSKRRLAKALGDAPATALAERLITCALEDLTAWPGPTSIAPAEPLDLDWLGGRAAGKTVVMQGEGNLGARINRVSATLGARGFERQLFIGIDCPELDPAYLRHAAAALDELDAVLGPATDGGVVVMGTRRGWPGLADLPWSTDRLHAALDAALRNAALAVATLEPRADIDSFDDLIGRSSRLMTDGRPARQALARWLAAASVAERNG